MKVSLKGLFLYFTFFLAFAIVFSSVGLKYYLQSQLPRLQIGDISGHIFSGSMQDVAYHIRGYELLLGSLQWSLSWQNFLLAKPCIRILNHSEELAAEGDLCIDGFFRGLRLEKAKGHFPVTWLAPVLGVEINGNVKVSLERVVFEGGVLSAVNGDIFWRKAQLNNGEQWLDIGDLVITSTTDFSSRQVILTWLDDANHLQGPIEIRLVMRYSAYEPGRISGFIRPREEAAQEIHDLLAIISQRDEHQRYVLNKKF